MSRRPVCQILSKVMDISSATAWAAPNLLKGLTILSDTTVWRPAVDRENLKPYYKSEIRLHFSRWSASLSFTSFSKTLLTTERRQTGCWFLAIGFSPTFLKKGPLIRPSNNLENKSPSDTYSRIQLVCMKVQVHTSLKPPLRYNQNQMLLIIQGSLWPF